ncbi:TrbI/VirB10 family protein [Muribacter muris]|uniref:TrbI/VirB10 family protein n=1 Tax=Muribacter muris TaxID=67855 RepID=A0A4Y9JS50_9PAST|nr:type IV secretion system protein VirB10 [Muribacter muris]MBF0786021.1 type IV secretion system protein VirB10 [Muribacter muris]MBF0826801.1 type IV secretion system protein VirB10 [Muribacter muris]TFV08152.1 TrbI/VirB10 family protein [Muribacter muris]
MNKDQPEKSTTELNTDHKPEVSKVNNQRQRNKKLAFVLFALALIPIIFTVNNFYKLNAKKEEEQAVKEAPTFKVKSRDFAEPQEPSPEILSTETQPSVPAVFSSEENTETHPTPPKLIKSKSKLMIERSSVTSSGESNTLPETEQIENGQVISDKQLTHSDGDIFQSTAYSARKAQKSPYNANLLLKKGTFIQCSLRTKVVSTIAGNIGCIVAHDVYSANGNVLLIERGSEIFGEFRSGQLKQSEDRIFVIWSEIRTPKNVVINIDSGATDELGGTGIQGWTDTHFWQRFGGAILLSLIDDTAGYLAYRQDRRSGYDYTESSREATQQMAQTAVENMINIPPTLYKNHGDLVGVFVARDIDFSSVYKLRRK